MQKEACVAASETERVNAKLALEAAREGIVLLANEGVLPLRVKKVALFGAGARHTAKGGTGSGEVNNRASISVEEGLERCGVQVTTKDWLDDCDKKMFAEQAERDEKIAEISRRYSVFRFWDLLNAIALPVIYPSGREITEEDVRLSDTDTAIYVLTRQAGEGIDRRAEKGEYYLSDKEVSDVKLLKERYQNTILVINAGACIDMQEILSLHVGAVIYMGQAGQSGGLALAQLMLGEYNFSGKLAASWPKKLSDLPCHDSYSYLNGDTDIEIYKEGIYVGYRYYDTFGVEPQYAFGYGLSYTKFGIDAKAALDGTKVSVKALVRNVGTKRGKEVVQVYLSCPSVRLKREYQQLAAFFKTKELAAGETEQVSLSFDLKDFAAYDEARSRYVLEAGNYVVRVGNSSRNTLPVATVAIGEEHCVAECMPIRGAQGRVREIDAPVRFCGEAEGETLSLDKDAVTAVKYAPAAEEPILPEIAKMSDKELAALCVGDPAIMRGNIADVPGACGQIHKKTCKKYGYRPAVMADGPAGLRLAMEYYVEPSGKVKMSGRIPQDLVKSKRIFRLIEKIWSKKSRKAKTVNRFCTAWPSATVQAQSFFPGLVQKIGAATAEEMRQFGVQIWLAPGMNIQRFPLCGRNYEYYSEDPLLSAKMASALTLGVQANPNCAVTIKHYCCNNQEDNRMKSSSEINERALREIYLRAFGRTVREAHPKCVMSSYNKVNGVYVNSRHDLISDVLRGEFGFDGVVMTDWQTVARGQAVAGEVLAAENDLIMAGDRYQFEELYKALKTGKTDRRAAERSASRILRLCKELDT